MAGNANPSNQKRQSPSINLPWDESDRRHPLRDFPDVERRFREMASRLDENWWYINRITFSAQGGGRWATIVIAASDTDLAGKAFADYVCSGSGDDTTINQAITILEARGTPGRIVLLEGTYRLSSSISITALGGKQLSIVGMGGAGSQPGLTSGNTVIVGPGGSSAAINIGGSQFGGTNVIIRDVQITGGSGEAIHCQDASLEVTGCYLTYSGTGGVALNQVSSLGSNESTVIRDCLIRSTGSGGGAIHVGTGPTTATARVSVINNIVRFSGAGIGIEFQNNGTSALIAHNDVRGSAASGTCIKMDGNSENDSMVANNVCVTAASGITLAGFGSVCAGNMIQSCTTGIAATPFELDNTLIASNNIIGATTGVSLSTTTCTSDTVAFNKIVASGTAVVIGSGCTNCGVFYNDTFGSGTALSDAGTSTRTEGWFLTAASLPNHHTNHETGGTDAITGSVDGNARVGVRKNTGASTFKRRRLNFIEGANVALTVAEDSGNEEVDVTIAVSGIAGTTTFKNNGSTVGAESTLNVIPGSNITVTMTDTGSQINLTIAGAAGSGNAGKVFNHMAFL